MSSLAASLKDRVVLITGASSGFGAEAARQFACQGSVVVLAARRADRLNALEGEIRSAGGQAFALPLDIAEPARIEDAVRSLIDRFGRVDILFNNAGFGRLDWLEQLEPEREIAGQLQVNLTGLILLTRALLPHMYRRGAGHIINMSSVAGWFAAPLYTVYSASKYGVRGFTEALRREARPHGVQVSGIYPGPAATEFGLHTGRLPLSERLKLPGWLSMSSQQVARRVVRLAVRPRRALILPGYYRLVPLLDALLPGLVDWLVDRLFIRRLIPRTESPSAGIEKDLK